MTDKELSKLKHSELLELFIQSRKQNDIDAGRINDLLNQNQMLNNQCENFRQQVFELNQKLESKAIDISNAGSIAEAALKINEVFEKAQAAADQYLGNVRNCEELCQNMEAEAREKAENIVIEARNEADAIIANAEDKAKNYWNDVSAKLENFNSQHQGLLDMLRQLENLNK